MPQFQLLFNVLWWLFSSVAWIIMGIILRPSALWDFQEPHDYLTIASPALLGGLSQEIADDTGTVWLFPSWEGVSWYYFHPNFSLFILLFALSFPLIPSLQPHSRQLQELYTCLHLKSWARWGNKAAAAAKSLQSCPTLCDPVDGSPPGSPVPGILQARTLEWVTISFSNAWKRKVKVKSLSRVRLFSTPCTTAYQVPLSMGFSRQEYWSGVPLPSPGNKAGQLLITFCPDLSVFRLYYHGVLLCYNSLLSLS